MESGDGFSHILIEPENPDAGIVIEVKYSPTLTGMESACEAAMNQIKDKHYDERLRNEGRENITAFGIAFCKKALQGNFRETIGVRKGVQRGCKLRTLAQPISVL